MPFGLNSLSSAPISTQPADQFDFDFVQTVSFTQEVIAKILTQSFEQTVELTQDVDLLYPPKTNNIIEFTQNVLGSILVRSVSQEVDFIQSIFAYSTGLQQPILNTVVFTQDVSVILIKLADSIVEFTQEVLVESFVGRIVEQTVDFTHRAVGEVLEPCEPAYDPGLSVRDKIELEYGTLVVELRKPEFDNSEVLAANQIIDRYRKGSLRSKRISSRPAYKILTFAFKGLTELERNTLKSFIENSAGQQIKLTDWEDRIWDGFITNDEVSFVQELSGDCGFSTSLRFMGNLQ